MYIIVKYIHKEDLVTQNIKNSKTVNIRLNEIIKFTLDNSIDNGDS